MFNNLFFFLNRPIYEIMLKKIVQPGRPQLKIQVLQAPLCISDDKGYIHTLRICNTYCVFAATVVTRTRLDVKIYVHCLPCHSRFSTNNDAVRTPSIALSIKNT